MPNQNPSNLFNSAPLSGIVQQPRPAPVGVPSAIQPGEASTLTHLKASMRAIEGMTDPEAKLSAIINLQGTAAVFIARQERKSIDLANKTSGLPEITKSLEENVNADRNAPNFFAKYGATDSKQTEDVRKRYEATVNNAQGLSTQYINSDPEIAAVKGLVAAFTSIHGAKATKDAERDRKMKDFGPNLIWVANAVTPGVTPDGIVADFDRYNKFYGLSQSPILFREAVIDGRIPEATSLMAHIEAATQTGTKDVKDPKFQVALKESQRDLYNIQRIVGDDQYFLDNYMTTFLSHGQQGKKWQDEKDRLTTLITINPKAYGELKKAFALEFGQKVVRDRFIDNVDSWKTKNSEGQPNAPFAVEGTILNGLYSAVRKQGVPVGEISTELLTKEIGKLPKDKRAEAEIELVKVMKSGLSSVTPGYFGDKLRDTNARTYVDSLRVKEALGQFGIGEYTAMGAAAGGLVTKSIPGMALGGALGAGYGLYDKLMGE